MRASKKMNGNNPLYDCTISSISAARRISPLEFRIQPVTSDAMHKNGRFYFAWFTFLSTLSFVGFV